MRSNPRLKGVMALYREVFAVQRRLSERIPDRLPHIEGAQVDQRIEQGKLLIAPDELAVDSAVLKELMGELAGVLDRKGEARVEGLDAFLERELEDEERLRELADAFTRRKDRQLSRLMKSYSLDPAVLYMLLHVSLAPFYWKTAGALARKADLDQVPRGACPACGDLPLMGFLRPDDGLRVLECSLCGTRWGTPRIMCPFCGTTDQKKLKYIYAGEEDSRRAYLCEACGKYLKVSSPPSPKDEEFVLPLEDLATAHLDLAAQERGYERGCRTAFS